MITLQFYDGNVYLDEPEWILLCSLIPFFQTPVPVTLFSEEDGSVQTFKKLVVVLLYGKHTRILTDLTVYRLATQWNISALTPWKWELVDLYQLTHMDHQEHQTEIDLRLSYSKQLPVPSCVFSVFESIDFTKSTYPYLFPQSIATPFHKSIPLVPFVETYPNELWSAGEALVNHIKRLPITAYDFYFTCTQERAQWILDDIFNLINVNYVSRTPSLLTCYTGTYEYRFHLTLYRDVQHILVHQYVDCCCIATNGTELITLPRGYHSLQYSIIVVNPFVWEDAYIDQLVWFSKRGFLLQCPNWKPEWEDEVAHKGDVYESYTHFTGLRKLAWCLYHTIHPSTHYELCKSTTQESVPYYLGRYALENRATLPFALSESVHCPAIRYVFQNKTFTSLAFPHTITFSEPVIPIPCTTFYQWFVLKNEK